MFRSGHAHCRPIIIFSGAIDSLAMAGHAPRPQRERAWRLGASRQPRRDALSFLNAISTGANVQQHFLLYGLPEGVGSSMVRGWQRDRIGALSWPRRVPLFIW